MYHTEVSMMINRTIADVFAVISDLNRHKEWQDDLIEARWASEGTPGAGSTFVFVTQFAGMRWDLPGEVTLWDPPNGWQWKAHGGPFPVQGGFQLEQREGGTQITMFSDSEPKGWMNIMRALLKWMGERSNKHSLTHLKTILEAE